MDGGGQVDGGGRVDCSGGSWELESGREPDKKVGREKTAGRMGDGQKRRSGGVESG